MNKKGVMVKDSKILILGITFKENCPDIRNTKIVDIYSTLSEYTSNITIYDPWADSAEVKKEYNIDIINEPATSERYDAVILGVAHKEFMSLDIRAKLNSNGVVYDVKGILPREIVDGRL
jgi:UDP-N-acetyl-D-galactosamine dehydrogenase